MRATYRRTLVSAVLLAAGCAPAPASEIEELDWLVGTWKRDSSRGAVYETWAVLSERTMEGASHRVLAASGEKRLGESLLLAEMGGDLYYIPRPVENPYPVAFRLVELEGNRAVFENPSHDFPQRIIYERRGDDRFTASIEGPIDGSAEPRRIDFQFTRVE